MTDPTIPVANLASEITTLAAAGGKLFMVPNLPLLGDTPAVIAKGPAAVAGMNALSMAFDGMLHNELNTLQQTLGITIYQPNIEALFQNVIANPSAYGFTNVTDPLLYSSDPTQSGYLFWDTVHPTKQAGQFIADVASASMVPEPSSLTLVLIAAPGMLAWRVMRKSGEPEDSVNDRCDCVFHRIRWVPRGFGASRSEPLVASYGEIVKIGFDAPGEIGPSERYSFPKKRLCFAKIGFVLRLFQQKPAGVPISHLCEPLSACAARYHQHNPAARRDRQGLPCRRGSGMHAEPRFAQWDPENSPFDLRVGVAAEFDQQSRSHPGCHLTVQGLGLVLGATALTALNSTISINANNGPADGVRLFGTEQLVHFRVLPPFGGSRRGRNLTW